MSGRGRATFEKRRKEMARKEKQQKKEERRVQRKQEGPDSDNIENMQPLTGPRPLEEIYGENPFPEEENEEEKTEP